MTTNLCHSCILSSSQVCPHPYSPGPVVLSAINESMNTSMSSATFPSHLQLELVLLSSSSTGLTGKIETLGWCRCTRQFRLSEASVKAHKRWVSISALRAVILKPPAGPRQVQAKLGHQCKTIYLQYLFSESQLYITFNTGLQRFIVQTRPAQTAKLLPESYLRPPEP